MSSSSGKVKGEVKPGCGGIYGVESEKEVKRLKSFVLVLDSSDLLQKFKALSVSCKGALKVCRDKLKVLQRKESADVLFQIGPNYREKLILSVENIYWEEVDRAKEILEKVDNVLSELQAILEAFRKELESGEGYRWYEECRAVLVFLRLRANLYRFHLTATIEEFSDSEPLGESFLKEEDHFNFLLAKISLVAATV